MALKDEWQVDIDLSCIERYITDLAKTEPKLRKKIVRSSLKRGNKMLQAAEKTARIACTGAWLHRGGAESGGLSIGRPRGRVG